MARRSTEAAGCWALVAGLLFLTAACSTPRASASRQLRQAWWVPSINSAGQYMLDNGTNITQVVIPGVNVYFLDYNDTATYQVQQLKAMGHRVVAYFSGGTYEQRRPDAALFPPEAIGADTGWTGERWIDFRHPAIRPIMEARIALAASKGFDAVDPDNVDGFRNDSSTGLPLTGFDGITFEDQLDYNRWLAATAHSYGLGIDLKNDLEQLAELMQDFDFAVNEHCSFYKECNLYNGWTAAGKWVLNIEYRTGPAGEAVMSYATFNKTCASNRTYYGQNITRILKDWNLVWPTLRASFRAPCPGFP